jgi:hypothetical protein
MYGLNNSLLMEFRARNHRAEKIAPLSPNVLNLAGPISITYIKVYEITAMRAAPLLGEKIPSTAAIMT